MKANLAARASTLLALLSLPITTSMPLAADRDFSERLDALWVYDAPAISEARFRAELAKHSTLSREARETTTQVARALGLQRKFAAADAALDTLASDLDKAPARIRVRYLLERGRIRNSSGNPAAAVPLFKDAAYAALKDTLSGADFYRVDALHMLGIATPPDERLDWNLRALAAADASIDVRARDWRGSLLNNIGWIYHDRGDYATALDYWQKGLAAREAAGDERRARIAKWTVARGLRSLNRLDEAEKIQHALVVENETAGTPDGFVYEELAEIALARNDGATAKTWAAKAYNSLKNDVSLAANEKTRLARLAEIGGIAGVVQ
jgi:tetratricopeptide (TPR) repeat protein